MCVLESALLKYHADGGFETSHEWAGNISTDESGGEIMRT